MQSAINRRDMHPPQTIMQIAALDAFPAPKLPSTNPAGALILKREEVCFWFANRCRIGNGGNCAGVGNEDRLSALLR